MRVLYSILGVLFFYFLQNFILDDGLTLASKSIYASTVSEKEEGADEPQNSLTDMKVDKQLDNWLKQAFYLSQKELKKSFLGDYVNPLTLGLLLIPCILIISYLLSLLLRLIFLRYFLNYLRTKVKQKKALANINKIPKSVFPVLTLLSLRLCLVPLEAILDLELSFLTRPVNAALILVLTLLIKRVSIAFLDVWNDSELSKATGNITKQLLPLASGISDVVILAFGMLFAVSALGINIAPFVASFGALTFAIGFAVKDSLSNFVAGIILILDETFHVGDKIQIPDIGFGYIHEISLRTTRILTFDNEMIIIPNNILMNKEYKNYGLPDNTIRVIVLFTVAYGSDVLRVKEAVSEIFDEDETILKEPAPQVEFLSMDDFALSFRARVYVSEFSEQFDKKLELTEKIYNKLNAKNIAIPFPTHTVYLNKG